MNIGYILGPAGSGKSHMTQALFDWMNLVEMDVITLNMDPGVVRLPYSPDIDVRQYVDYNAIVDEHQLGPNGGLIAAMDQVAIKFDQVLNELGEFGSEYVLVDFPGQIETVAFRSSGSVIINELAKDNQISGSFLIDPTLCLTASSFISVLLFGVSIQYRLQTAMNYQISKGDLLRPDRAERIKEWTQNPEFLYEDLGNERFILNADLSRKIAEIIILEESLGEFPVVSAHTNENLDIVFGALQRNWSSEDLF